MQLNARTNPKGLEGPAVWKRIPIWIIDDNKNLCLVLSEALNRSDTVECVHYYTSSRQALDDLKRESRPPRVILLDIRMRREDGLDIIVPIKECAPETAVIMLTSYDSDKNLHLALKRGASGYLLKSSSPSDIVRAIEVADKGGSPADPFIAKRLMNAFVEGKSSGDTYDLSAREKEVLRCIADGLNSLDTSQRLGITRYTVETHIKRIFQKLAVHNRHGLVAKALREHLI